MHTFWTRLFIHRSLFLLFSFLTHTITHSECAHLAQVFAWSLLLQWRCQSGSIAYLEFSGADDMSWRWCRLMCQYSCPIAIWFACYCFCDLSVFEWIPVSCERWHNQIKPLETQLIIEHKFSWPRSIAQFFSVNFEDLREKQKKKGKKVHIKTQLN